MILDMLLYMQKILLLMVPSLFWYHFFWVLSIFAFNNHTIWGQVKRKPVIAYDYADDETLIADLGVRGVWSPQSEALFDICVIDTDTQSYLTTTPNLVLFRAEGEKKQKYSAATTARPAHFTLLCFSVDGIAGSEAACFLKRLAGGLSSH